MVDEKPNHGFAPLVAIDEKSLYNLHLVASLAIEGASIFAVLLHSVELVTRSTSDVVVGDYAR